MGFSTLALIAASALALLHGQDRPAGSPFRSLPQPGSMFADEFSAPALDRSKWNVIVTGQTVNDEQQAYVDSPETIALVKGDAAQGADDGALEIRTRSKPGFLTPQGKTFDFISGRIDTRGKFDFTYGTAEARIKLTPGAGLWPAFWALGNDKWPDTGEMDILENVGDPTWTNFALHGPGYSGANALVDRKYFDAGTSIADWHVYAMAWTPNTLVFRVDGRDAYRVTRRTVEQHGPWAYDNPKHLIINQAIGGVYPHAVNKTAVPYFGLPQSTVDLVKADKAVMLVDWVRVVNSPTVQ